MEKVKHQFTWSLLRRKEDNQEDERARTLHLSKRMQENEKTQRFLNELSSLDGVEGIQPQGPYAVSLFIGHCFNVQPVVEDVERLVKSFLSDIVVPQVRPMRVVKHDD